MKHQLIAAALAALCIGIALASGGLYRRAATLGAGIASAPARARVITGFRRKDNPPET